MRRARRVWRSSWRADLSCWWRWRRATWPPRPLTSPGQPSHSAPPPSTLGSADTGHDHSHCLLREADCTHVRWRRGRWTWCRWMWRWRLAAPCACSATTRPPPCAPTPPPSATPSAAHDPLTRHSHYSECSVWAALWFSMCANSSLASSTAQLSQWLLGYAHQDTFHANTIQVRRSWTLPRIVYARKTIVNFLEKNSRSSAEAKIFKRYVYVCICIRYVYV